MQAILNLLSAGFHNIAPVIILLGLLIFVHELGHFLVARWCGVRVEVFSMGFGKRIFEWKPGDTTYCISIIPIGGYVKMYGDDRSAEVPLEMQAHSFLHKPVAQRIAIVLAGPLMNLFFAIFLYMAIGYIGEEMAAAHVGDLVQNSVAYKVGFRSGDKILQIDGKPVKSWNDVQTAVEDNADKPLTFVVEENGSRQTITATPKRVPNDNVLSAAKEVGQIDGLTNEMLAAVVGVLPDSPAAKGGVRSLDLIASINDHTVAGFTELQDLAASAVKSGHVKLKLRETEEDDKPENTRTVEFAVPTPAEGESALHALGVEESELYIYKVSKNSPAGRSGFEPRDRILAIDGQPVSAWTDFLNRVKGFKEGGPAINVKVRRGNETKDLQVAPEMTDLTGAGGQEEKRFTIGVISGSVKITEPTLVRATSAGEIASFGLNQTEKISEFMVMGIVRMLEGRVSSRNLGGVITIGRIASRSFEVGLTAFLNMMALISINLFMINLIPVPALDGGHLLFYSIEALRGAPLPLRKIEIATQVGVMLLIMLMAYSLFNDVTNFFSTRW